MHLEGAQSAPILELLVIASAKTPFPADQGDIGTQSVAADKPKNKRTADQRQKLDQGAHRAFDP